MESISLSFCLSLSHWIQLLKFLLLYTQKGSSINNADTHQALVLIFELYRKWRKWCVKKGMAASKEKTRSPWIKQRSPVAGLPANRGNGTVLSTIVQNWQSLFKGVGCGLRFKLLFTSIFFNPLGPTKLRSKSGEGNRS